MPDYLPLPSIDDLLTEAWERCTLSPSIITADMAQSATRSIGAMLIDWTNRGINLWQVERRDTIINVGQSTVPAPVGSVDVLEVMLTTYGNETSLFPISRDEWAAIPNKGLMGCPNQYWSERTADGVVLHVWPAADRMYRLAINRIRMPYETNSLGDRPDAPALWTEALYAGLAARLAAKFKPELEDKRTAQAQSAWSSAAGEDRERVNLTLMPSFGWR